MSDTTRDTALQNIAIALSRIAVNEVAVLNIQSYSSSSFTPSLTFGGSASGMTIATSAGHLVQLGNYFIGWFSLKLSAKGASTGVAAVSGWGMTSNSNAANSGAGGALTDYGSMASISSLPFLQVGPSSSSASLRQAGAVGVAALTDGNFTNLSSLSGNFTFFI